VIGTISRTVVRLSRSADSSAVVVASVDARRLSDLDHQHHPDQQPEGVPVDRLDRGLLMDGLREQQQNRAQQRDLGAIDALGRDQRERAGKQHDSDSHEPASAVGARSVAMARRSGR
jgi:hypothetical protein